MLTITENAKKELDAFFADKEKSTVRIFLAPGGCSGPRLSLALDEAMEDDEVMHDADFTFCVNKKLWEETGGATIDLSYMGFTVEPVHPLPGAGASGCAGCGGSCGTN